MGERRAFGPSEADLVMSTPAELGELLKEARRVFAAKRVVTAWDAEQDHLRRCEARHPGGH